MKLDMTNKNSIDWLIIILIGFELVRLDQDGAINMVATL